MGGRGRVRATAPRRWQARAVETIRIVLRHNGPAGLKAMMKLIGLDCGPTRLPIAPLRPGDIDELQRALDRIGFFEWIEGSGA